MPSPSGVIKAIIKCSRAPHTYFRTHGSQARYGQNHNWVYLPNQIVVVLTSMALQGVPIL